MRGRGRRRYEARWRRERGRNHDEENKGEERQKKMLTAIESMAGGRDEGWERYGKG